LGRQFFREKNSPTGYNMEETTAPSPPNLLARRHCAKITFIITDAGTSSTSNSTDSRWFNERFVADV